MFAYETNVQEQISQKRDVEVGWMRKKFYLRILSAIFGYVLS